MELVAYREKVLKKGREATQNEIEREKHRSRVVQSTIINI